MSPRGLQIASVRFYDPYYEDSSNPVGGPFRLSTPSTFSSEVSENNNNPGVSGNMNTSSVPDSPRVQAEGAADSDPLRFGVSAKIPLSVGKTDGLNAFVADKGVVNYAQVENVRGVKREQHVRGRALSSSGLPEQKRRKLMAGDNSNTVFSAQHHEFRPVVMLGVEAHRGETLIDGGDAASDTDSEREADGLYNWEFDDDESFDDDHEAVAASLEMSNAKSTAHVRGHKVVFGEAPGRFNRGRSMQDKLGTSSNDWGDDDVPVDHYHPDSHVATFYPEPGLVDDEQKHTEDEARVEGGLRKSYRRRRSSISDDIYVQDGPLHHCWNDQNNIKGRNRMHIFSAKTRTQT